MVADAALVERGGERIAGELWVATRSGIAPHVHDLRDPMGGEQAQELSEFPSRVSDRVDHVGKKAPRRRRWKSGPA